MRILLDECVAARLRHHFPGHDCQTVCYAGFARLRNGELLQAAELAGFQALLTIDQRIPFQQNLIGRKISLLILYPKSNRFAVLVALAPACLAALESIQAGQIVRIGPQQ